MSEWGMPGYEWKEWVYAMVLSEMGGWNDMSHDLAPPLFGIRGKVWGSRIEWSFPIFRPKNLRETLLSRF